MPELSQLACTIDLGVTHKPLTEYNRQYTNKHVSCYVCVPDYESSIAISLKSIGYVGPGLAAFVFIDGQYQANRNRTGLMFPNDRTPDRKCFVDFKFRQKEELQDDETTIIGRGWTFAKLQIVRDEEAGPVNTEFLDNLGTIEVVVLRCKRDVGSDSQHMIDISNKLRSIRADQSKRTALANFVSRYRHDVRGLGGQLDGTAAEDEAWQKGDDGDKAGQTQDWERDANAGANDTGDSGWHQDATLTNNDTSNDNKKEDTPAVVTWEESPAVVTWEDTPAAVTWEDTPAVVSWEDNDPNTKEEDRPAENTWETPASNNKSESKDAQDTLKAIKHTKKDYWARWDPGHRGYGPIPTSASREKLRNPAYDPYVAPEYVISSISAKHANSRGIEAHIRTGRGARYRHAFGRPEYIDSMDSPYAVFTFHYRTANTLSRILKNNVEPDCEDEPLKLKKMSRTQLESELLKYKAVIKKKDQRKKASTTSGGDNAANSTTRAGGEPATWAETSDSKGSGEANQEIKW